MKKLIIIILFIIALKLNAAINIEFNLDLKYYNNNFSDLNYSEYTMDNSLTEKGYTNFLLYIKEYDENKSLFSIGVNNLDSENNFLYELEIEFYENLSQHLYKDKSKNFFPLFSPKSYDQNFPYKAYVKYKNIKFGRDKLSWGSGKYGNLILSDFSKFYDHFTFNYQYKNINYEYAAFTVNPYLTDEEYDKIKNNGDNYYERIKMFAGHKIDFRFYENFVLSLMEAHIIGGKSPDFNMINPLFIFHNTYTEEYSNVIAGIDLSYKDENSKYYVSFAVDNWNLDVEKHSHPKQLAYLGGFEKEIKNITVDFEYARTSRWIYNRDNEYLKFTNRRHMQVDYIVKNYYYIDYPIGYYLGPDAETFNLGLKYKNIKFVYQKIWKGELNLRSDYGKVEDKDNWFSLCGIVEKRDRFSLRYDYKKFYADILYENIVNFNNENGIDEKFYRISLGYKYNKLFFY